MNEVLSYVYDFLSMVFEDDKLSQKINEVFLFGSVAKNTYDAGSDIDIFFDVGKVKKVNEIEKKLQGILKSFEVKSEKTWKLKGDSILQNSLVAIRKLI